MINEKNIRMTLKAEIDRGNRRFVIYPFSVDGMNTKKILQEAFGITPVMIVDNGLCGYENGIVGIATLRKRYEKDMLVLLASDDMPTITGIMASLVDFVPIENIVDLTKEYLNLPKKGIGDRENYSIARILQKAESKDNKIKIRFVVALPHFWNVIASVFSLYYEESDKYDILLIFWERLMDTDFHRDLQQRYKEISIVNMNSYHVDMDMPDVMFQAENWVYLSLKDSKKYSKHLIFIMPLLHPYGSDLEGFYAGQFRVVSKSWRPDYFLVDSYLFHKLHLSERKDSYYLEMGNPKYDEIYQGLKNTEKFSGEWEKARNKHVIGWIMSHGLLNVHEWADQVSFDLYAEHIIQLAKENPDLLFVLRFHPVYITELLLTRLWSEKDFAEFRDYCTQSDNLILDESVGYQQILAHSNAILTDGVCGITLSALPTQKPIGILRRYDRDAASLNPDIDEHLYNIKSIHELDCFIEMIRSGDDPMYDQRRSAAEKYVCHFDGRNGLRIKELVDRLLEE